MQIGEFSSTRTTHLFKSLSLKDVQYRYHSLTSFIRYPISELILFRFGALETNFKKLETGHICSIGAVFDFYAGTVKRAPKWMINAGFEWLYRLLKEPKRMWHRYLIGNTMFCFYVLKEKLQQITSN